jgi:hypothetical protein
LYFGAGTVTAPSISTTGDSNTGIYFPAADQVAITTGGTQKFIVDASGNVGIGASSPAAKLEVDGQEAIVALRVETSNTGVSAGNYSEIQLADTGSIRSYWRNVRDGSGATIFSYNDNLRISQGSTEVARFTLAGNFGVGTTSPASRLHVNDSAISIQSSSFPALKFLDGSGNTDAEIYFGAGGGDDFNVNNYANGPMIFRTNNTERARITSGGDLGIGSTSPSGRLTLQRASLGASTDISWKNEAGDDKARIRFGGTDEELAFWTGSTPAERARIDSTGRMVINGTTQLYSATLTLYRAGNSYNLTSTVTGTGNEGHVVFENGNGAVGTIFTNGTATAYNTSSDYRLKNTIAPMTGALAKVALLKPCTYKWNADGSDGQGFIAHELAEVVPQCVTGEKDAVDADGKPKYQGVDTSFLVATLTAAIQEQQDMIDELKAEVASLKGA